MPENILVQRMSRAAKVSPATINEAERTVDVTFTTGSMVRRFDWFEGEYEEVLDVTPEAVNLERLNNGAPLLTDHECYDIDAVCGVVERAWIEDGEGRATVRFSDDADSEKIWQKVKSRILRSISVGYEVTTYQEIIEGARRILRAISWTPLELSLVAIPADAKANIRSAKNESRSCNLLRAATPTGDSTMTTNKKERSETAAPAAVVEEDAAPAAPAAPAADAPATPAEPAAPAAEPAAAPATDARAVEIMELCELSGASLARAREMVKSGKTVAEVRTVLVNERATRSTQEIATQVNVDAQKRSGSAAERMKKQFGKA